MSEPVTDGEHSPETETLLVDQVAEYEKWVYESSQIDKAFTDGSLDAWLKRQLDREWERYAGERERFLADYDRPT